jgi:hypothetical protein
MKIGNNEIVIYEYESNLFLDILLNGKLIRLNDEDMTIFISAEMTNGCSDIKKSDFEWLINKLIANKFFDI